MAVTEIYNKKEKNLNIEMNKLKTGMIKKKLQQYGIDNYHITKNLGEPFYIFTKHKGTLKRIGIAKLTEDKRLSVDRLFNKTIKSLGFSYTK